MTPIYGLTAATPRGNRVKQFHGDNPEAARFLLSEAGRLRYAGFDIGTGASPQLTSDGSWEVVQGARKSLRLYQDGTLIFRAAADESFLGWGQDSAPFRQQPKLNSIALVEVHASFVSFYGRVLERFKEPPTDVLFRMELRNATLEGGQRLFLTRVPLENGPAGWIDERRYQVQVDPAREQLIEPAPGVIATPMVVAYRLVERFYGMFDAPADIIPLVAEIDGIRAVDIEALRALS